MTATQLIHSLFYLLSGNVTVLFEITLLHQPFLSLASTPEKDISVTYTVRELEKSTVRVVWGT